MKILLIEDEKASANIFIKYASLVVNGYEITWVKTMREGRDAVGTHDVIVCDLTLPDSSPMETISTLKEWTAWPVVVYSHENNRDIKVECLKAGVLQFLSKHNLTSDKIQSSIQDALGQSSIGRLRTLADVIDNQTDTLK